MKTAPPFAFLIYFTKLLPLVPNSMPHDSRRLKIAFLVVDDRFGNSSENPKFGPAPSAVLQGLSELPDEIEVHVISCTMGQVSNPEKLASNVWFHSRNVTKSGFLRTLHRGCYKAVREMLVEIQPDIVHAQGTERWCAVSGLQFAGPKVLTVHGNLGELNKRFTMRPRLYWGLQTLMHHFAVPRYDVVACISNHVLECLEKRAKQTCLIPNAIRSEFFDTPKSVERRQDRIVFLNIGVFAPWKRQHEILTLAKRVWMQDPRTVFRFIGGIGEGDYGQKCMTLIQEGEQLGFVEFAGSKTTLEVIAELDAAHAMIHCPIEETFGLVVAEALARDMKFFGSAVGGVKDITANVPGCVLKNLNDWAGLEAAILTWLRGGATMPSGTREIIQSRYAPIIAARNHLALYHELLGCND